MANKRGKASRKKHSQKTLVHTDDANKKGAERDNALLRAYRYILAQDDMPEEPP